MVQPHCKQQAIVLGHHLLSQSTAGILHAPTIIRHVRFSNSEKKVQYRPSKVYHEFTMAEITRQLSNIYDAFLPLNQQNFYASQCKTFTQILETARNIRRLSKSAQSSPVDKIKN